MVIFGFFVVIPGMIGLLRLFRGSEGCPRSGLGAESCQLLLRVVWSCLYPRFWCLHRVRLLFILFFFSNGGRNRFIKIDTIHLWNFWSTTEIVFYHLISWCLLLDLLILILTKCLRCRLSFSRKSSVTLLRMITALDVVDGGLTSLTFAEVCGCGELLEETALGIEACPVTVGH